GAPGVRDVGARPGLHAGVVGAGRIGLLAVAMRRLVSPVRMTLVGSRPERLALGRRLGATEVVDVNDDAAVGGLDGRFDLVFEAANRPSGGALALRLARRGGTVVLE